MSRCFIEEAISSLFPGESPQYSLDGETVGGVTWLDPVLTEPTAGEITAALAAAEAAWNATSYLRARSAAAAAQGITVTRMADALYAAAAEDDSTDLEAISAKLGSIKEDNPIPEEV
jgi:hypothetical protein